MEVILLYPNIRVASIGDPIKEDQKICSLQTTSGNKENQTFSARLARKTFLSTLPVAVAGRSFVSQ
jgi:hypothetical protein